jgi:hypothetical protein
MRCLQVLKYLEKIILWRVVYEPRYTQVRPGIRV